MKNLKRLAAVVMAGIVTFSQSGMGVYAEDIIDSFQETNSVSENELLEYGEDNSSAELSSYNDEIVLDQDDINIEAVEINEINFPNEQFRKRYINPLDKDKDGILSVDEINAVNYLNISDYSDIDSIKGIECFVNLSNLKIEKCRNLTELDISNNINLAYISVKGTGIKEFDFSNNPKLNSVEIDRDYYGARVSEIKFAKENTISHLKLDGTLENGFELDLSNLDKLKTLYINKNTFSKLDISNNHLLESLNIENVSLIEDGDYIDAWEQIDLSDYPNLTTLDISHLPLKTLDVSNNKKLEKLVCDYCYINNIIFSDNCYIKSLECSNNSLKYLDLSKLSELKYLKCSNNLLTFLELEEVPQLEQLICEHNNITYLELAGLVYLNYLNCADNKIARIDFCDAINISTLICTNNKLTFIDIPGKANIAGLYCAYNNINELDLSGFYNLETLNCSNNNIAKLDLSGQYNLYKLLCYSNKFAEIDITETSIVKPENFAVVKEYRKNENKIVVYVTEGYKNIAGSDEDLEENNIEVVVVDKLDEKVIIDESTFPDEVFRKLIEKHDSDEDGYLSYDEIKGIKKLEITDYYLNRGEIIYSLDGIQYLKYLSSLVICNMDIKDLNLEKNEELCFLQIVQDPLQTINLSGCKKLRRLLINNTEIMELDLSNCNVIKEINLEDNAISEIVFPTKRDYLKELNVFNNMLSSLDLSNMYGLETLKIAGNNITDLYIMETGLGYGFISDYRYNKGSQKNSLFMKLYVTKEQYDLVHNENIEGLIIHEHVLDDTKLYFDDKGHFYKCHFCSQHVEEEKHAVQVIEGKAATCIMFGNKTYYKCKCGAFEDEACTKEIVNLDKWMADNRIPAKGHHANLIPETPSSCIEPGIAAYYQCECGYYEDEACTRKIDDIESWKKNHKVSLAEHTWDNGVITTLPTFINEGMKTYKCRQCGEVMTKAVERVHHIEIPVKGKYDMKPAIDYVLSVSGNSAYTKLKYTVDNKKIATISNKGILKAKKDGDIKITVYGRNAEKKYALLGSIDVKIINTTIENKIVVNSLNGNINLTNLVKEVPYGYSVSFELSSANSKKAELDKNTKNIKILKKGTIVVKCVISDGSKYQIKKNIKIVVKP